MLRDEEVRRIDRSLNERWRRTTSELAEFGGDDLVIEQGDEVRGAGALREYGVYVARTQCVAPTSSPPLPETRLVTTAGCVR